MTDTVLAETVGSALLLTGWLIAVVATRSLVRGFRRADMARFRGGLLEASTAYSAWALSDALQGHPLSAAACAAAAGLICWLRGWVVAKLCAQPGPTGVPMAPGPCVLAAGHRDAHCDAAGTHWWVVGRSVPRWGES